MALRNSKSRLAFLLILLALGLASVLAWRMYRLSKASVNTLKFNGQRAFRDVEYQVSLGPRIPQSAAHSKVVDWLVEELQANEWESYIQEGTSLGHTVRNVIGRYGQGRPWILLGAHYDSRLVADRDPEAKNRDQPVPGANDGASGVAVLLELSRILPAYLDKAGKQGSGGASQVWLVFFDAEDNGNLPGWDWILGSRVFVDEYFGSVFDERPDAAVILDMIGDSDLQIYMEKNSNPQLNRAIWDAAERAGYANYFIPQYGYSILDDHLPFRDVGIPAADVIDFKYLYWHTLADTSDKVSGTSLQVIGDTILLWLTER